MALPALSDLAVQAPPDLGASERLVPLVKAERSRPCAGLPALGRSSVGTSGAGPSPYGRKRGVSGRGPKRSPSPNHHGGVRWLVIAKDDRTPFERCAFGAQRD